MATGYKPRQIRSKEERNSGRGSFITLKKTGDAFLGFPVFKPDPEIEDNPGYYEYMEHYTPTAGYFPCAGDDCPLCEEGDNPSTRAKSVWLVVDNKDPDPANGELKIFNLNWYGIEELADLLEEDEPVQGQLFRVRRAEGNGRYSFRLKSDKMTAALMKKTVNAKDFPDLEAMTTSSLNKKMEEAGLEAAMQEDDDDDKPASRSRKGTEAKSSTKSSTKSTKSAKADPEPEPEQEFDPEAETEFEGVATIVKIVKTKNIATVEVGDVTFDIYGTDECDLTGFAKGDTVRFSAVKDDDDDFVASDAEEADTPAPDDDDDDDEKNGEAVEEIDGVVSIVSIDSDEDTMEVEDGDGNNLTLYFLGNGEDEDGNDWSEFDIDDFEEGDKITVLAKVDDDGDLVVQNFPTKASARKATRKTSRK